MVEADLCIPHKYLGGRDEREKEEEEEEEEKEEKEKRDYANLQDAAIWRQVRSLPQTTESAISVQQPLIDLSGKKSCPKPCSVILFCSGMEIIICTSPEFLSYMCTWRSKHGGDQRECGEERSRSVRSRCLGRGGGRIWRPTSREGG